MTKTEKFSVLLKYFPDMPVNGLKINSETLLHLASVVIPVFANVLKNALKIKKTPSRKSGGFGVARKASEFFNSSFKFP